MTLRGFKWFAFGVLLAIAGGVLAQGGYPTIARFLRVGINTAPASSNGTVRVAPGATAATSLVQPAADATLYSLLGRTQAGPGIQARWDSGTTNRYLDIGAYDNLGNFGSALLVNVGASTLVGYGVDMTPESGTFTATFATACTTSPTLVFDYQRVGNVVTIKVDSSSGFPCTSDDASFLSGTDIPASIRPTDQNAFCHVYPGFQDNGATSAAWFGFSTAGVVSINRAIVSGANIVGGTWTASGNKSASSSLGFSCAYMLGDP